MSLRETLTTERETILATARGVIETVEAEARDLTDAELSETRTMNTRVDEIDARIAELDKMDRAAVAAKPAYEGVARVGREERTYNPSADVSFIADIVGRSFGDADAAGRLARHMQEERVERPGAESRAIGTSALGAIVVPQYLVDLYAPKARAGRKLADLANKHQLPSEGMTATIPLITTGSTAAAQSSQNASVSETNIAETDLSVPVITIAGQQTVSAQAVARGRNTESIVVADLVSAYNTKLDSLIINGTGSSGEYVGIISTTNVNSITYTSGSPTGALAYSAILNAVQTAETATFKSPDLIVMHPRRWASLLAYVSTNQTLFGVQGAGVLQAGAGIAPDYSVPVAGTIAGINVITDGNIPTNANSATNQDTILVLNTSELHLFEDAQAPLMIRAEQTSAASLGVLLVVFGFSAFTADRYGAAHSRIVGTGLVTPTF
jgi:HK97 family phage major capsid protein